MVPPLGEPGGAPLVARRGGGSFSGGAPGSPASDALIGYLAPQARRRELAAAHLRRAAAFYREQLEERRAHYLGDVTSEWEAWVEGLEADADRLAT